MDGGLANLPPGFRVDMTDMPVFGYELDFSSLLQR